MTLASEEVCSEGRLDNGVLENITVMDRDGAGVGGARVNHQGWKYFMYEKYFMRVLSLNIL